MNVEYPKSSQEDYLQRDYHYPKLKARFGRKEALALLSFPIAMALTACAGRSDAAASYRRLLPLVTNDYDHLKPTPTPDTRPNYPWPAEIIAELDQLPVLDRSRLRLGFYTTMDQIPYADIRALFRPPVGENADVPRRMIHILATDSVGGRDWLYGTWGVFNVGHAVGHFHQAEMSRQIGMDPDSRPNFQQWYLNTPEGRAYVPAANAAKNNASSHGADLTEGLPWEPNTFGNNPYEDAASMISLWYNQPYRFDNPDWAPLKEFAGQWWPKISERILTPIATPDIRPNYPWPEEMAQQLAELTVLDEDKLRFGYYTDRSQIPYPDIYAMFTGDGSGNADVPRRMVHVLATDRVQREWFVLITGHERGHFHQAEQSRLIGMDPDSRPNFQQFYLNTAEGREFVAASNAAIEYARSHGIDITSPFMHNPFGADDYEDAADVVSYWFNRRRALDGEVWSSVRDWATKWLHR